jgi:hypothetical protein
MIRQRDTSRRESIPVFDVTCLDGRRTALGSNSGNCYHWVDLKDDLTVSLLQARLIELNLPINVRIGT